MKITFAVLALSASAALAIGCSTEGTSAFASEPSPSPVKDDSPTTGTPQSPTDEDATAKVAPYRGNPLCHVVNSDACMPDDDGTHVTAGTKECALPAPDAGDAATASDFQKACRIAHASDGTFGTKCSEKALAGGEGATCQVGDDCAAGFDCVAGEKSTKTCRHYCCAGSCKGHLSQNLSATFCDIQALVDVPQKAPVCMPIKHCKLLGTGECTTTETCAVVTEAGDTGCVAIGDQQVGASCDADHCAASLTCLGQPGSRKCYKLCKLNSNECGASQVCATTTVFKDPTFGICQKP